MIYECVVNISSCDNSLLVSKLENAVSETENSILCDVHSDIDHNRSVFTFVSRDFISLKNIVKIFIEFCFSILDIRDHIGVHPRIGVVDVIPFVVYDEDIGEIDYAKYPEYIYSIHSFAESISSEFCVPIFLYDYADTKNQQTLPDIRKFAFNSIKPDIGNNFPHEQYGAIALGIRKPLIAINVNLESNDLSIAKRIAFDIRESSGGYKGVRSLGLNLNSKNSVQVSINIIDLLQTNISDVCLQVKKVADELNIKSSVELVGLIPKYHFVKLSAEFLEWSGLNENSIVENYV